MLPYYWDHAWKWKKKWTDRDTPPPGHANGSWFLFSWHSTPQDVYRAREMSHLIWVFPKWLSLNSANSVNHDLIQNSMVTRDILYLTLDTFLEIVVKNNFPLLSVGWYLFRVVTGNRYLPQYSKENTLCITSTGNVYVARWVIPLVTILLLDLVMIHWIRWIQGKSFRENSIKSHKLLWLQQ